MTPLETLLVYAKTQYHGVIAEPEHRTHTYVLNGEREQMVEHAWILAPHSACLFCKAITEATEEIRRA